MATIGDSTTDARLAATLLLLGADHRAVADFVPPGSRVLAIVTAAKPACVGSLPPKWLQVSLRTLRGFGLDVSTYDVSGKTVTEIANATGAADVVYVSGGNSFFLLENLRASGGDIALRAFLADPDHVYIGASAGAVVLAPDIAYAAPVDDPDIVGSSASTQGLGVVPFAPLPHAARDAQGTIVDPSIQACRALAHQAGIAVIEFADTEALVVDHSGVRRVASRTTDTA